MLVGQKGRRKKRNVFFWKFSLRERSVEKEDLMILQKAKREKREE